MIEQDHSLGSPEQFLLFRLDEHAYALKLEVVDRVIRAVEIRHLPKAPTVVRGIVDVHGRVLPVLDIRQRFQWPTREVLLEDEFILARTRRRAVVLWVDSVGGVIDETALKVVPPDVVVPGMDYVAGVARTESGTILIHDLDRFLSLDDEERLEEALEKV